MPKVSYLAVHLDNPKAWAPDQMLRELLSQMESGDLKAGKLVAVWTNFDANDPDDIDPGMAIAGCTPLEAVGLLSLASAHMGEGLRGISCGDEDE